jgi:excisionase family DNA binding protein
MSQSPSHRPIQPEARLWTVPQTARVICTSVRSVYRLIAEGELKVKKIGRSTRVVAASVEQFLKGGR